MKKKDRFQTAKNIYIAITMTILLLILMEVSIFIFSEWYYAQQDAKRIVGYDDAHTAYLEEFKELRQGEGEAYLLCPYIGQCTGEYASEKFNLLGNGERKTINPCEGEDPIVIYALGGSTTISAKVFDEHTWSSLLSKELCDKGYHVQIRNFGQSGYINDQEMIKLLSLLKQEEVPDYVLFFDGSNEYYTAYQNGEVGVPQNFNNLKQSFTMLNSRSLFNPFFGTSTFKALRFFNRNKKLVYSQEEIEMLSVQIKENYVANARIIGAVGEEYGFVPIHFWQPTVFTKAQLSEYEQRSYQSAGHRDFVLLGSYNDTSYLSEHIEQFYDLTDIFDSVSDTIFTDHVHTSVPGELVIAQSIAPILIEEFENNIN